MTILSLFFLRLLFQEADLLEFEEEEDDDDDDLDLGKCDFFGVVGGEENVAWVAGVVGRVGVLDLTGVDGGGCSAGSAFTVLLPVPLGCLTSSGLGSFFSSAFFSERRVLLEEEVPAEALLGLLIGRVWVEGISLCGRSVTGGRLSTVLASFTGTMTSGAFRFAGVGRTAGGLFV